MSGPFKMKGSSFYGHGNASPAKIRNKDGVLCDAYGNPVQQASRNSPATQKENKKEEKVKTTMGGTKDNPTITKSKGDKTSTYSKDPSYDSKGKGGTQWINESGNTFLTDSKSTKKSTPTTLKDSPAKQEDWPWDDPKTNK